MTPTFLAMADRLRRVLMHRRETITIPTKDFEAFMEEHDDMQDELKALKNERSPL